ncbi:type I-F CRISPR-associated protein Csy2 [Rhodoferax sp.]|uniref:type I-F CRISPR-associated protein Csy2 n=1 Tax=Rhodoferax sp. TaxID=50421 RepID=UPI00276D1EC3|nr:type I-F CRISPR-associated protein Csy2 [Rhodoferax sp.]
MKPDPIEAVLLLPRLRVQNANAVSSPLTWGFPAPSAFTGFTHALQRRLNAVGYRLNFGGVGIVCHQFDPQVFQPPGRRTQVFRLTRNPVDKDGDTSAIVEEGRTHLEISLVLTVAGEDCPYNEDDRKTLAAEVLACAEGMRLAGGSVLPNPNRHKYPAQWITWPDLLEERRLEFRRLRRRLMPGFALVSREQLLAQHIDRLRQTQPQTNALDALLDLCRLNIEPQAALDTDDEAESAPPKLATTWAVRKQHRGWLVPLPVGYAAISPLYQPGEVKNARDSELPFRFVESVLTLGEWLSPHRIAELPHLLWHHDAQPDAGLYRVYNPCPPSSPTAVTTPIV